jgi:hypothetical protein
MPKHHTTPEPAPPSFLNARDLIAHLGGTEVVLHAAVKLGLPVQRGQLNKWLLRNSISFCGLCHLAVIAKKQGQHLDLVTFLEIQGKARP